MNDLFCKKTGQPCQTPSMCAPFGGCQSPEQERTNSLERSIAELEGRVNSPIMHMTTHGAKPRFSAVTGRPRPPEAKVEKDFTPSESLYEPLRPERCPCCGAHLVGDQNDKRKYREFAYACGAEGWHDERFPPYWQEGAALWVGGGAITWSTACPRAMDVIIMALPDFTPDLDVNVSSV